MNPSRTNSTSYAPGWIELHEFAQHIPLIGEAFGLIKGMLIDVIDASDADPDDYIDDLDRLDQVTQLLL